MLQVHPLDATPSQRQYVAICCPSLCSLIVTNVLRCSLAVVVRNVYTLCTSRQSVDNQLNSQSPVCLFTSFLFCENFLRFIEIFCLEKDIHFLENHYCRPMFYGWLFTLTCFIVIRRCWNSTIMQHSWIVWPFWVTFVILNFHRVLTYLQI